MKNCKTCIKLAFLSIVGLIVWPIITVFDLALLIFTSLVKVVRVVSLAIFAIVLDEDEAKLAKEFCNDMVNDGYKTYVDWLYPTEEEELA